MRFTTVGISADRQAESVSGRNRAPGNALARYLRRRYVVLPILSAGMTVLTTMSAVASDYGCRVLLCLSNPSGPTAVSQCVPPISQLWRDLARGRAFPRCEEANTPANQAWAQMGTSYYDVCPAGTTALAAGALAVQGGPVLGSLVEGIGDGDALQPDPVNNVNLFPKTCVGQRTGQANVWLGDPLTGVLLTADVFDRVVVLDPQISPRVIDVYVNSQLYRRVRW